MSDGLRCKNPDFPCVNAGRDVPVLVAKQSESGQIVAVCEACGNFMRPWDSRPAEYVTVRYRGGRKIK